MKRFLAHMALAMAWACVTPAEKKQMQGDIFNVQTRLLNLEQELNTSSKESKSSGDQAAKRIANTKAEMERFTRELQEIRGEIDALKVGVTTGAMPGADPSQEGTLAYKLDQIMQRLEQVEAAQGELLDVIKKAGRSAAKDKDKDKKGAAKSGADDGARKGKPASTVDELQKDFDAKRFKQVSEDAGKFVKAGSAGDQEKARFLWAESLFKLGKMRDAALKYNDFLEGKPSKKLLPLAKMRIGDCFRHLGDGATAKLYYEELIKEFPDSDEAAKAKERLAEIGKGGDAEKG